MHHSLLLTCPECYKKCRSSLHTHIKSHGYSDEEFLKKYPEQILETETWKIARQKISDKAKERMKNPNEVKKISEGTKTGMAKPESRERFLKAVQSPKSESTLKKLSDGARIRMKNPELKKKMYTEERNEKISKKKYEYWKSHPEEKIRVSNIWKKVRDKDPIKWKSRLLSISQKGFSSVSGIRESSLEKKYYEILKNENIQFVPQYKLGGKLYDAYLPKENILLEFDGEFWHPKSIEECQYEFQKKNFLNDAKKDKIAKIHGVRLIRIREGSPIDSIERIISDIYT